MRGSYGAVCFFSSICKKKKKKEADNAIYVVSFQFQWEIFFANLMFCSLYNSLLRIFLWSLGVHCMKGMIFKVGHSFNTDKHHSVSVGVFLLEMF